MFGPKNLRDSQPIRCKTEINYDFVARVSPRFDSLPRLVWVLVGWSPGPAYIFSPQYVRPPLPQNSIQDEV